jgi:hypothetical protein
MSPRKVPICKAGEIEEFSAASHQQKNQRLQLLHPELVKGLLLQRLEFVLTLAVNNRNFDSNKQFVETPEPRADAKIPNRAALLICVV